MEKKCELCKVYFRPTNGLARNCDECRARLKAAVKPRKKSNNPKGNNKHTPKSKLKKVEIVKEPTLKERIDIIRKLKIAIWKHNRKGLSIRQNIIHHENKLYGFKKGDRKKVEVLE